MKYRKRPVEVEAIQWLDTPESTKEVAEFKADGMAFVETKPDGRRRLQMPTLEGTMEATPGDWIIKGVQGEVYPCKPEIFHATYIKADKRLTDQELPAIDRIWGNSWKAQCFDYAKELINANRGIARLKKKNQWLTDKLTEIGNGCSQAIEFSQRMAQKHFSQQAQQRMQLEDRNTELKQKLRATELALCNALSTLRLIATPKRPDGTYNRSREACEQLAASTVERCEKQYEEAIGQ
jgi:hypothetical protein